MTLNGEIKVMRVVDIIDNPMNPKNATQKQLDKLKESFKRLGYIMPIIVNKENKLIDGHQRMKNVRADKYDLVEVLSVDIKDENELLALLVTNQIYGKFDQDKKQEVINLLESKGVELASVLANYAQVHSHPSYDEILKSKIIDIPEEIGYGQVVHLGRHTIICGDSTDPEIWAIAHQEATQNKQTPYMVLTSPPYFNQRDYSNWSTLEEYLKDIVMALDYSLSLCEPDGLLFINIGQDREAPIASLLASEIYKKSNVKYLENICWNKVKSDTITNMRNTHIRTSNFYYPLFKWENIFVYQKGERHRFNPTDAPEISEKFIVDMWDILSVHGQALGHPAMFPIELARAGIICYTSPGDTVLDPYIGSGSTLLAAELTGRTCIGIELDQNYCKLAMKRFNDLLKEGKHGPGTESGQASPPNEEEQEEN